MCSSDLTVWFSDGTIVLVVEDEAFCVYGGMLAQSSAVFRDMLLVPQLDAAETFEGRPLVRLHDSKLDLTYFLKALHNPRHVPAIIPNPANYRLTSTRKTHSFYYATKSHKFEVIAGVLRVSTKYAVQSLRKRSIQLLSLVYPNTFKEMQRLWKPGESKPRPRDSKFDGLEVRALQLARECRVPILLPFLLYRCCLFPTVDIAIGTVYPSDSGGETLDPSDRLRCLKAKGVLYEQMRSEYTAAFLYRDSTDKACGTKRVCDHLRLQILKKLEDSIASYGFCNFLDLQELRWQDVDTLCVHCRHQCYDDFKNAQVRLWDELPNIFGLDDWPTIRSKMGDDL